MRRGSACGGSGVADRSSRFAFRPPPGQTFSDVWYRVAETRPRLSVHARFVRQRQGPTVSFVVEDPAGGNYYRLSESARFFVGMLDGRRTTDDAWQACLAQLGDEAPTQRECIELLAQLQLFGLLTGDQPLAADMLAERHSRFRAQRLRQRTGNWMYFHIPLFNPEPFLHATAGLWRLVWGWPGLVGLLLLVGWAAVELVGHLHRFASSLNTVLSPSNLAWLGVFFLIIRLLHELGHATACKAMGGRCTEIGVMMIAFILPLPYCDATSSWRFPDTWRRVLVALGGVLVETALAAVAAIVWVNAEAGLVRTLAFNVMVISGVTTLLFNLNPLLRYDGYYILSDLTGSPNLAGRAKQLWHHVAVRHGFGVLGSRPPYVRDPGEARFLLAYHALAVPYRLFIVTSILLLIMGKYLTLGLVLAAVFGFIWLLLPMIKGLWFLAQDPQLVGRRARAWGVSALVLAPLLGALALVPLPSAARVPVVVDWAALETVRAEASGYIDRVHVRPGERATAGEVIVTLRNESLVAAERAARARREAARISLTDAAARGAAQRRVAEAELRRAEREAEELARQVSGLRVVARRDGIVATPRSAGLRMEQAVGRFVNRGEILLFLLPDEGARLLAAVPDDQASRLLPAIAQRSGSPEVVVRLRGAAHREIDASIERIWPAGSRELPTPALAASTGGEVLQDPSDPSRALHPLTQIELRPASDDGMLHGRRGFARFELEPEPLVPRAVRYLRRLLGARTDA